MDDEITDAEIIPPEPKKRGIKTGHVYPKAAEKREAFALLMENGVEMRKAAEVIGYSPKTAYHLKKKLNTWDRRKDRLLSKSVTTLEKFVEGKPIGGEKVVDPETGETKIINQVIPKCSTVMRATEAVLDRQVPKINLNANVNIPFMPIDPDKYL